MGKRFFIFTFIFLVFYFYFFDKGNEIKNLIVKVKTTLHCF